MAATAEINRRRENKTASDLSGKPFYFKISLYEFRFNVLS